MFRSFVASAAVALALIHGRVVAVDVPAGTLQIHHDPFREMPMAMTMIAAVADRRELRRVRRGERVTLRCDVARDPWQCRDLRPEVRR